MPTNLPPEYFEVERLYRAAKTPAEKVALLEELISTIPKHKGTDKLRADLRRKLSKLRETAQSRKGTGRRYTAFRIPKEGAGQTILVGPTNTGKSALLAALTKATPEVSEVPYTTWQPAPGMMQIENVQVQLIDTPSLDREFVEGELIHLIRGVDLILPVVDLQTYPVEQLEETLALLRERRIVPDLFRDRPYSGRRLTFKPFLVLANKADDESTDELFAIFRELMEEDLPAMPVSATTGRNLDRFRQDVFQRLGIIRVYTKPPGKQPNFDAPFVLRQGGTVAELAAEVHQDFYENLKTARVWGSTPYDGQMVGRDYVLQDGDIVELRI